MSTSWITLSAGAVGLFWAVGAYNRLVSMRNEITRCYEPVHAQLQQRSSVLTQWVDSLHPVVGRDVSPLQSVAAASQQLIVASEHLSAKPAAAQPAASVRMADETLGAARARLLSSLGSEPQPEAAQSVYQQLQALDNTLSFARHQFNHATQSYNDALMQFPTWVIAGIFGFRAAGTL